MQKLRLTKTLHSRSLAQYLKKRRKNCEHIADQVIRIRWEPIWFLVLCLVVLNVEHLLQLDTCIFSSSDYVVVGSDSGRIVILEYIPSKNQFEKIHQETFGKSGCRRIVPGQYLAVDPKGRAVMIGRFRTIALCWAVRYL